MERLDKIKLAIEKGFTYDQNTGIIYGIKGKEITGKSKGYIVIKIRENNVIYMLLGHQFAYYIKYGKVVDILDHINGVKDDNRICNLRSVSHQQNQHNRHSIKGYHKTNNNRFRVRIGMDNKLINIGSFNTPEQATQAYLDAKKTYHKI